MRSDDGGNKALYAKEISAKEIVREGKVPVPAAAKRLLAILTKASRNTPYRSPSNFPRQSVG